LALPFVKGDLVTYLTDDDIFYPIRFEKMVEAFQQNPKINVVYGKQKVVMISNNRTMRSSIRPLVGVTRSPMNRVDHNSFMHRKSCLDIVRNWDDHPSLWMAADAAFFKKLAAHWDFYPINVLTDEHRIHDKGVQKKLSRGLKPWIGSDAE
jgi:spore maturation protein CgeD